MPPVPCRAAWRSSGKQTALAEWRFRGDVLARARESAGLSQRALAAAIHITDEDRVGLWERGEARPQPRVIPLLAQALRIDPLALLAGTSDTPDLTRLRVAAGMTLQDMAARVGLPVTSYHRLERRGAPQDGLEPERLQALAAALGITATRAKSLLARHR